MLHFFGILSPSFGKRTPSKDAPHKTDFFHIPRAEQDANYLTGHHPEPADEEPDAAPRLVRFHAPRRL